MASVELKAILLTGYTCIFHVLAVLTISSNNFRCNPGFEHLGEWCFSFHLDGNSVSRSNEICEMSGGKMAILDQRKINVLQPYIKAKGITPVLQKEFRQEIMKSYQKIRDVADYAVRYCRIYKKFKLKKPTKELYTPNQELPLDFDENHRANETTPPGFSIETSSIPGAGLGAWTKKRVRMFTVLGEYEGEEHKSDRDMKYSWIIYEDEEEEQRHYIDAISPSKSNWLRYINCARNAREENVHSFPCDGLVFYMTTRDVEPDTELLTWYGRDDGLSMGITRIHPVRDLKLQSAFYVRVRYRPQGASDYEYGLWDPFSTGGWTIQPENNYTFYTGREGLPLPFICEHDPQEINI